MTPVADFGEEHRPMTIDREPPQAEITDDLGNTIERDWKFNVGIDRDGRGIAMEVTIHRHPTVSPYQSTAHEPQTEARELTYALSTRTTWWSRGDHAAGEIAHARLLRVSRFELLTLIHDLDRWHLSGMNGACDHMPHDAHARWDAGESVICPETGYSYGQAWLSRHMPQEVANALADRISRLAAQSRAARL